MTPPPLPPLRPRSATEIVDAAVQLVRAHFGHLLQVAALGTLPSLAVVALQAIVAPGAVIPADPTQLGGVPALVAGLSFLVSLVASFATQGALAWSGLAALQGAPLPAVTESFRVAFRRLPALVLTMLVVAIAGALATVPLALGVGAITASFASFEASASILVIAGLTLFVLVATLGLGVYGLLALATSLVVLERAGPLAAIARSLRLARGSVLRLVAVWLIGIALFIAIFATVFGIAAAVGNQDVASALGTVLAIPTLPVFGMLALVQYADLRARREGADLEAALGALAAPAPLAAPDASR